MLLVGVVYNAFAMRRYFVIGAILIFASLYFVNPVFAQVGAKQNLETTLSLSSTPTATPSATNTPIPKKDVTQPEKDQGNVLMNLFKRRPVNKLSFTNFIAYGVQYSVKQGVPANTIILILLLPVLATIVVFLRYIIGLSGLGLLVPIALSITLLSTGLIAGFILLTTILVTSYIARIILKRIRIMQLPKLALSMWLIAIAILAVLTISTMKGILTVQDISIFPILLLVILSDRVVALFLERSMPEVIQVTLVTIILGLIGYVLFSWDVLRNLVIIYPEVVLLCVPLNIMMGRYFGLRATEYMRFKSIIDYGSK